MILKTIFIFLLVSCLDSGAGKTQSISDKDMVKITIGKAYPQLTRFEVMSYAEIIYHFCFEKYSIPFEEPCAIIQIETRWNPTLVSTAKCRGLGQLSVAAASEASKRLDIEYSAGLTEWFDINNLALSLEYYCFIRKDTDFESAAKCYIGGASWPKASPGGAREAIIKGYAESVSAERLRIKKILAEVEKLRYIKGGVRWYAEHSETNPFQGKK